MLKFKWSVYLSLAGSMVERSVVTHGAEFHSVCAVGTSYDREKASFVCELTVCVLGSGTESGAESVSAEFSPYGTTVVCESFECPLESLDDAR